MIRQPIWIVLLIALLFAAFDASATGNYPGILMDSSCTDTEDTPAEAQAGTFAVRPLVQLTGSLDGFCDHDSRVLSGPVTADTQFGPFKRDPGAVGFLLFVDADVVSNDTDTWQFDIKIQRPHEAVKHIIKSTASQNTEGNSLFAFLPLLQAADAGTATEIDVIMHEVFWITLELGTATSWDGNISVMQF